MARRRVVLLLACVVAASVSGWRAVNQPGSPERPPPAPPATGEEIRRALFQELQPVALANCELERFGEPNDGGYLMCGNLLGPIAAGYSYGISGYDGWGCDVSRRTGVTIHQYDCFDPTQPPCEGGATVFHDECVAGESFTDADRRIFDTIDSQLTRTGSAGKRIVLKMDVEGAEWDALLKTPEQVFRRIDQLAIELHGVEEEKFLRVVRKLKDYFHVAHLHFNNYTCTDALAPFPAWAYEVLFVNRDVARVVPGRPRLPHPLDAPNNPKAEDCARARPTVIREQ